MLENPSFITYSISGKSFLIAGLLVLNFRQKKWVACTAIEQEDLLKRRLMVGLRINNTFFELLY